MSFEEMNGLQLPLPFIPAVVSGFQSLPMPKMVTNSNKSRRVVSRGVSRNFIPHGDSSSPDFSNATVYNVNSEQEWRTTHMPGIGDALTLEISKLIHTIRSTSSPAAEQTLRSDFARPA